VGGGCVEELIQTKPAPHKSKGGGAWKDSKKEYFKGGEKKGRSIFNWKCSFTRREEGYYTGKGIR